MREILTEKEIKATKVLRASFSRDLDKTSAIDRRFQEDLVLRDILEGYTMYTHPEYKGLALVKYQEPLKQDIIEYVEDRTYDYSVETLTKIAYFRLEKASKKYYLQKTYSDDSKLLKDLSKQAKEAYKEYKLIDCLL